MYYSNIDQNTKLVTVPIRSVFRSETQIELQRFATLTVLQRRCYQQQKPVFPERSEKHCAQKLRAHPSTSGRKINSHQDDGKKFPILRRLPPPISPCIIPPVLLSGW